MLAGGSFSKEPEVVTTALALETLPMPSISPYPQRSLEAELGTSRGKCGGFARDQYYLNQGDKATLLLIGVRPARSLGRPLLPLGLHSRLTLRHAS
jgi:hypothetical protein